MNQDPNHYSSEGVVPKHCLLNLHEPLWNKSILLVLWLAWKYWKAPLRIVAQIPAPEAGFRAQISQLASVSVPQAPTHRSFMNLAVYDKATE